jgi:diguanylate cyclase (GGDEF)-like protein
MKPILHRLSTRYAVFFAALLSMLMLLVLTLTGYFAFSSASQLRTELTGSFSLVQSTDDIQALSASGTYLSSRLFDPLRRMDVQALNEEIERVNTWLKPVSTLILDPKGRIVTDGGGDDSTLVPKPVLPRSLTPDAPVVETKNSGRVLFFAIAQGDDISGYARIELSDKHRRALVNTLQHEVQKAWKNFEYGLLTIVLISISLITAVSLVLGARLSVSLSRPLTAMAHAADEYAAGNLSHKLPAWPEDELGRLASSLNEMSEDLQKTGLLLTRAQEMASLGSWEWRRYENELILSHGVYRILDVSADSFRPTVHNLLKFVAEQDQERLFAILQGRFEKPVSAEFKIRRSDGESRTLLLMGEPETDRAGNVIGFLGTMQDVTEQRRSQEQLVFLANYDDLTHLPNRNLFYDRLRHAAKKARRRGHEVALLFFDLDRFKAINDALGHDVGDDLLRHVARRLKSIVRDCDTLARMGGDEFTLIIEEITEELAPQKVAQNIIDVLTASFRIDDREL